MDKVLTMIHVVCIKVSLANMESIFLNLSPQILINFFIPRNNIHQFIAPFFLRYLTCPGDFKNTYSFGPSGCATAFY